MMELPKSSEEMKERIAELMERSCTKHSDAMAARLKPEIVSANLEEQSVVLAFTAQHWQRNFAGMMHGGIIAAILDTSIGYICYSMVGGPPLTASLSTNYLRPGPISGKVHVVVKLDKLGKKLLFGNAKMYIPSTPGKFIATANATYIIV